MPGAPSVPFALTGRAEVSNRTGSSGRSNRALLEIPDQRATGYVVPCLKVGGEAIAAEHLERIASRAEVIVQILAAQAQMVKQLEFDAAAGNPAEQIWLRHSAVNGAFASLAIRL